MSVATLVITGAVCFFAGAIWGLALPSKAEEKRKMREYTDF